MLNSRKDDSIVNEVHDLRRALAGAAQTIARIERQLPTRLARGSVDVTTAAKAAALGPRLEEVLRTHVYSFAELVAALGVPPGRVSGALGAARRAGYVANVGRADEPRWTWVVGDEGPTQKLRELVLRLLAARPITIAELVSATGARDNRVKGVLMKLTEEGRAHHDDGRPALWSTRRRHAR